VSLVLSISELELDKQRGELRKACSKFGHATQPERRVNTTVRLRKLREVMTSEIILGTSAIDAYLVTSSDEHQSTEVEEYEKRREYISGFSGSYGDAVITQKKAALWTDGRYHLQADEQIDCHWLLFREGHKHIPKMSHWLKEHLPKRGRIGFNPKLVSEYMWTKLKSELKGSTLDLVALNVSLVDVIWPPEERQPKESKPSFVVGIEYTGKNYTTKINETRREIQKLGADAMVITSLDEIAWLLNIRGRDVPFSPFLRSYVILDMNNIFLYVNSSQLNQETRAYLHAGSNIIESHSVILRNYADIWNDLKTRSQLYDKILVPSHCVYSEGASHAIYEHIYAEKRLPRQSPIIFLKAVKNHVEIRGMREANILDAAAVCDCLAYIENKVANDKEVLSELDLVTYLDEHRYEQYKSFGNSFRTIAAFGPNAAYPKYEPTPNTNLKIFQNNTVLLDSGGQYYGGTTVVTRTVHFGEPTDDMKEAYTRVLIGLIQLSSLTFPSHMKMAVADVLTRASLWEVGLDYEQETGHGIGAFLGTHESPIKVHFDSEISMQQVFKPGYFFTNAPGFYSEGEFGVRLENMLEVYEKKWLERSAGYKFLGFRTVTLVPFEPKLIKLDLLSTQQRRWLNVYNTEIRQLVGAKLKSQNRMDGFYWMMEKTKYIPDNGDIIKVHPLLLVLTSTATIIKTYL
ncbi:hypothetical protein NQ315_008496, partial [Exocentrus adspersus]